MPRKQSSVVLARYVYLDVVRFSGRSVEEQTYIIGTLNRLVREALAAHQFTTQAQRILLPTGDGLCIAIIDLGARPDVHVRVALDFLRRLHEHNQPLDGSDRAFQVRVGINSNPDNRVTDVNGKPNIAGAGINMAQRIMSLADAGQVLVGTTDVNALKDRDGYRTAFEREYVATVKHNVTIRVHQLVMESPGLNVSEPSQLTNLKLEFPQQLLSVENLRTLPPEVLSSAGLAIRRAAFPLSASPDIDSYVDITHRLAQTQPVWRTGYEIRLDAARDPDDPGKFKGDAHFKWTFVNHTSSEVAVPQTLYTTPALEVDGKPLEELLDMHGVEVDAARLSDFAVRAGETASEFAFTVNVPPASVMPKGLPFAYQTPYVWDLGQPWFVVVYTPICDLKLTLTHPEDTDPELYVFGVRASEGESTPLKPRNEYRRKKSWVYDGWLLSQHGLCLVLYPLDRRGTPEPAEGTAKRLAGDEAKP